MIICSKILISTLTAACLGNNPRNSPHRREVEYRTNGIRSAELRAASRQVGVVRGLNLIYSDYYHEKFDNTIYYQLAKDFITDKDAVRDKVLAYYMYIVG